MPAPVLAVVGAILFVGTFIVVLRGLLATRPERAPLRRQLQVAAVGAAVGVATYLVLRTIDRWAT